MFFQRFPGTFWLANTMEIFERMAWYGFYAVSSLYITGSVESGGLGLSSEKRGIIQGIIPFLLYLFPVVTGALADKFGYKRTFFTAYAIMTPAYYLMGQPDGFWGFFFTFLLVAIGAATFKPVVVGTVSHVIANKDKSLGFGIFYMMVNIGGFAGPIVAGIVRNNLGWPWVFRMSSIWIACNFIWLLFYKEPEARASGLAKELAEAKEKLKDQVDMVVEEAGSQLRSTLSQIGAILVRLAPTFIVAGFLLGWVPTAIAIGGIVAIGLLLRLLHAVVPGEVKLLLRKSGEDIVEVLGNGAFFVSTMGTIFLLMLAGGDWVSWADMGYLIAVLLVGNIVVDIVLRARGTEGHGLWQPAKVGDWRFALYLLVLSGFWTEFNQLFITLPEYIRDYTDTSDILNWMQGVFNTLGMSGSWNGFLQNLTRDVGVNAHFNINPEFLINIDAGAIVLFQVMISAIFAKRKPFTTMIVGTILTGVGMAMNVYGGMGWIVVAAIFVFAIGEMMASPKSQEYVSLIAPKSKTAMYMGYYFVSVALGNLFGGILSGQMYGHFGPAERGGIDNPGKMWLIFGIIGVATAFILFLYDRIVVQRHPAEEAPA